MDDNKHDPSFDMADGVDVSLSDLMEDLNRGKDFPYWQVTDKGHHLEWAIFHSCQTNNANLKNIMSGNHGHFFGVHRDWNGMLLFDSGLGEK